MAQVCPLCGSSQTGIMFYKIEIPYYRCRSCTFVFSRPQNNANFTNTLDDYEASYLNYLEPSVEDEIYCTMLLEWVEQFRPLVGCRILDVGAGSGKFVRFLRQHAAEAYGIEPAGPLYEHFLADEAYFSRQTIEELAASSSHARFDLVFACDVLEHVARPDRFLQHVSQLLSDGGMLFVMTADVRSWYARLTRKWWHHYNKYHLSYFSRSTLAMLAARYQLREVDFQRFVRPKSCGYLLEYCLDFFAYRKHGKLPAGLQNIVLPINLYDTMSVCLQKLPRTPAEQIE